MARARSRGGGRGASARARLSGRSRSHVFTRPPRASRPRPTSQYNLGVALSERSEFEEAIIWIQRSLTIEEDEQKRHVLARVAHNRRLFREGVHAHDHPRHPTSKKKKDDEKKKKDAKDAKKKKDAKKAHSDGA